MKKALIMLLLVMAIVGSFGVSQAAPPDGGACSGTVDIDCDYDNDGDGDVDQRCLVWVDLRNETGDPTAALCGEAPAPPAI